MNESIQGLPGQQYHDFALQQRPSLRTDAVDTSHLPLEGQEQPQDVLPIQENLVVQRDPETLIPLAPQHIRQFLDQHRDAVPTDVRAIGDDVALRIGNGWARFSPSQLATALHQSEQVGSTLGQAIRLAVAGWRTNMTDTGIMVVLRRFGEQRTGDHPEQAYNDGLAQLSMASMVESYVTGKDGLATDIRRIASYTTDAMQATQVGGKLHAYVNATLRQEQIGQQQQQLDEALHAFTEAFGSARFTGDYSAAFDKLQQFFQTASTIAETSHFRARAQNPESACPPMPPRQQRPGFDLLDIDLPATRMQVRQAPEGPSPGLTQAKAGIGFLKKLALRFGLWTGLVSVPRPVPPQQGVQGLVGIGSAQRLIGKEFVAGRLAPPSREAGDTVKQWLAQVAPDASSRSVAQLTDVLRGFPGLSPELLQQAVSPPPDDLKGRMVQRQGAKVGFAGIDPVTQAGWRKQESAAVSNLADALRQAAAIGGNGTSDVSAWLEPAWIAQLQQPEVKEAVAFYGGQIADPQATVDLAKVRTLVEGLGDQAGLAVSLCRDLPGSIPSLLDSLPDSVRQQVGAVAIADPESPACKRLQRDILQALSSLPKPIVEKDLRSTVATLTKEALHHAVAAAYFQPRQEAPSVVGEIVANTLQAMGVPPTIADKLDLRALQTQVTKDGILAGHIGSGDQTAERIMTRLTVLVKAQIKAAVLDQVSTGGHVARQTVANLNVNADGLEMMAHLAASLFKRNLVDPTLLDARHAVADRIGTLATSLNSHAWDEQLATPNASGNLHRIVTNLFDCGVDPALDQPRKDLARRLVDVADKGSKKVWQDVVNRAFSTTSHLYAAMDEETRGQFSRTQARRLLERWQDQPNPGDVSNAVNALSDAVSQKLRLYKAQGLNDDAAFQRLRERDADLIGEMDTLLSTFAGQDQTAPGEWLNHRQALVTLRQRTRELIASEGVSGNDLQRFLSAGMRDLSAKLIKAAAARLGPPPVPYTVLALGSAARGEASPFSDLEFAILTEADVTEEQRRYFVTLSSVVQSELQALGETQTNELGTGFHWDTGGNTPVGKPEAFIGSKTQLLAANLKFNEQGKPEDMFGLTMVTNAEWLHSSAGDTDHEVQGSWDSVKDLHQGLQDVFRTKAGETTRGETVGRWLLEDATQLCEKGMADFQNGHVDVKNLARLPMMLAQGLAFERGLVLDDKKVVMNSTHQRLVALQRQGVLTRPDVDRLMDLQDKLSQIRVANHLHAGAGEDKVYVDPQVAERENGLCVPELRPIVEELQQLIGRIRQYLVKPGATF